MDSFKTMFKIIGLLLTGFIVLTCTEDQTPTEPHIDYISPLVEWLYPHGGSELSGVVELRFSVYDEGGIDSACVYINGSLFGEGGHSCSPLNGEGRHSCLPLNCVQTASTDTIFSLSWNTLAFDDGVYILEARAWDEAGNLGTSPSLVVNVRNGDEPPPEDRLPPDIWWTAPEAGSTVEGDVLLQIGIYDENDVDSVRLIKNGEVVYEYHPGTPPSIPPRKPVGREPVTSARQAGGIKDRNNSFSPSRSTARNNSFSPPRSAARNSSFTPPRSAARNNSFSPPRSAGGNIGGVVEYIWHTRTDSDGVYVWEARAWDDSGNMGTSPSLLVRVKNNPEPPPEDRLAPDVWWTAPEPGSTLQDSVVLICRFFDESGVDSLSLSKNGAPVVTILPPYASRGGQRGGEYEVYYLWDTRTDSDGVYVWEARAWDASGNMGTSPALLVRVRNNEEPPPEDRTPPVVSWRSPQPGSVVSGEVELLFEVIDDVGVDSIFVYVNGAVPEGFALEGGQDILYRVTWITTEYEDGQYIIEARAEDRSGNIGTAPSVVLNVLNHPPRQPRVIWVPDDYEKIQDAVWHSENGDTIMVRAGEYREAIQMFDKNVSLVSEEGPEATIINSSNILAGLIIGGGQDTNMVVRGFTFINNSEWRSSCLGISGGSSPRVVNNIFTGPDGEGTTGIWTDTNAAIIRNNLFIDSRHSTQMSYCWGDFSNNIIIRCRPYAFWNAASRGQPLVPDYNLFWDSGEFFNRENMEWGQNNLHDREPLFEEGSYTLRGDSPGVDDGRPDIRDLDGSRSDIGVHGGPHAYTHP